MVRALAFAAIVLSCGVLPRAHAGEFVLRVLTYNLNGLPLGIGDDTRYPDVGLALARLRAAGTAPHLVAFQEAWARGTTVTVRLSGYPHAVRGNAAAPPRLAGSGIMMASEFPIERAYSTAYSDCSAHDCFARKGALHARIRIPGLPVPLDFMTTHMNASYQAHGYDEYDFTRSGQSRTAGRLIRYARRHDPEPYPLIFAGDFNFRAPDGAWGTFLDATGLASAERVCGDSPEICERTTGDDPLRQWERSVDHHFFRSDAADRVQVRPIRYLKVFKEPVHGRKLSDHDGLEIHYLLSWRD